MSDQLSVTSVASTARLNCWEFKKCGREPGGAKVAELGVCPAAQEKLFDGIFGGRNSGRACWVVAGTFCKGEVQGTFAQKFKNCSKCEFFRLVQREEGASFEPANVLMTYIDRTHEQRVDERTHELREAKDAFEAAKERLEKTNRELANVNRIAALDMAMAARVQAGFFPKAAPKSAGWDVGFAFRPVSGVSGDFYDFYARNGQLRGLSLFDVSGHGIGPGLVTLLACSIIHHQFSVGENLRLGSVVTNANRALSRELDSIENYLTGIVLRFTGNRVEYVNAGHPDLLLRRGGEAVKEAVKTAAGTVLRVAPSGVDFRGGFLGKSDLGNAYRTVTFPVEKGDALLLYSDCLIEGRNAVGEEFGEGRLARAFGSASDSASAEEIVAHVLERFEAFVGQGRLKDDLTVIVAKRISEANAEAEYVI